MSFVCALGGLGVADKTGVVYSNIKTERTSHVMSVSIKPATIVRVYLNVENAKSNTNNVPHSNRRRLKSVQYILPTATVRERAHGCIRLSNIKATHTAIGQKIK